MKDYSGAFDPDFRIDQLDHGVLAWYGREVMLANHIHDRAIMPQLALNYGMAAQTRAACDEWMGSSPIYNRRNRELQNIGGDNVETIFKAFQLDIGAPHTFLQFHWHLESETEGQFWLTHCGAYNHVRRITNADPKSETQICHHMEDPTFDATVMAINPLARCRAIFRPPHADIPSAGPCRWRVFIGDSMVLNEPATVLAEVSESLAANFRFADVSTKGEGLVDYSGAFDREFRLEDFKHEILARQCREFALDVHLLQRACYTSIARDHGEDAAWTMAEEQWRAMAPVYTHRLRKLANIEGEDMSAILKLLQLDPFLPAEYLVSGSALMNEKHGRFWVEECSALHDKPAGLVGLLLREGSAAISAPVNAVNPKARVVPLAECPEAKGRAIKAWDILIDDDNEPAPGSAYTPLVAGEDMWDHDASEHRYFYNN